MYALSKYTASIKFLCYDSQSREIPDREKSWFVQQKKTILCRDQRKFATTLTVQDNASYQNVTMLIFVQTATVNFLSRIALWQKKDMEHKIILMIARVEQGTTRWLRHMQQF